MIIPVVTLRTPCSTLRQPAGPPCGILTLARRGFTLTANGHSRGTRTLREGRETGKPEALLGALRSRLGPIGSAPWTDRDARARLALCAALFQAARNR